MRKKITIVLIIFFLLLTAASYGIGVFYFSGHFLPGSMVNGFNCSYMTAEDAQKLLAQKVDAYVLAIEEKNNGVESLTAEEAGLSYIPDGTARAIVLGQNRFLWFLAFGQHKNYNQVSCFTLDEEQLRRSVKRLRCMRPENVTEMQDAKIIETSHGFEIAPEVEGDQLDFEKVFAVIKDAVLESAPSVNLVDTDCYMKPAVYQDDADLVRNCAQANRYTSVTVTYDFDDSKEVVDKDLIKTWLVLDENNDYQLDPGKVAEYLKGLGEKYNSFGEAREFRSYDGSYILVSGGDYGWVIDVEAETAALIEMITSGTTDVRKPIYMYSAWNRETGDDIGLTYIEIDLTYQRLLFFKDGRLLVDTPVVTGNPNIAGNETPTGCFALDAKQSPATLKGEDYSSDVTYWMPFYGNVGLHDAGWRTEFGGSLYLSQGSHGCVNVPYEAAQTIYENIEVGAPVVVYDRANAILAGGLPSDEDFFE